MKRRHYEQYHNLIQSLFFVTNSSSVPEKAGRERTGEKALDQSAGVIESNGAAMSLIVTPPSLMPPSLSRLSLSSSNFIPSFQVVIVGNGAVGKSSMIQRYCKGIFTKNYKKTIGVDFLEKHIT